jgi:hypothetical protein
VLTPWQVFASSIDPTPTSPKKNRLSFLKERQTICFNLLNKKKEFECLGYKTPTIK